tara:strand:- start:6610 stop:8394 length:1785 start_codon:yes stop_codon:yes gene_type:complete
MATRRKKKIDNRTEEEKNSERAIVIIFFSIIGILILYFLLSKFFYVEMTKIANLIIKVFTLIYTTLIGPVADIVVFPFLRFLSIIVIFALYPIINYFIKIKKNDQDVYDFFVQNDGNNNMTILGFAIFVAIVLYIYFDGRFETFFYKLENIAPALHFNGQKRIKRLMNKYNKQISVQDFNFKSIQTHPCWNTIKKRPLCDFWICSSSRSYLIGWHKHDYASYEAITHCMKNGARYVELDIFNKNFCSYTEPVVCNGHTPGNYQYTTALKFDKCIEVIKKNLNKYFIHDKKIDPFFLCLNLHLEGNWHTLDLVAMSIEKHLGKKLLSKKPPFRDDFGKLRNLGTFKFEDFLDKVVIITNTYLGGDGPLVNSKMKNIYDICYQSLKIDVKHKPGFKPPSFLKDPTSANKDWLQDYSYEDSNNLGTNISKGESALVRIHPTPTKNCNWDYDIKDPKNKVNNWPETMFKIGSQFNLMDFASDDENLIAYLNFFFGPGDGVTEEEKDMGIIYYETGKCPSNEKFLKDKEKEMNSKLQNEPKGCLAGKNKESIDIRQRVEYQMNDDPDRCGYGKIYKGYAFALKPFNLQIPMTLKIDTTK